MNKVWRIEPSSALKQKGAAILLTVVLLLIMVTLVTLYTGKIQSFEHQIVVNTQNKTWAHAAAKAGLNQGLAILNVNKAWPIAAVAGILEDNSSFIISAVSEDLPKSRKIVTIQSSGKSADGLATATVVEQALVYPILFNLPPAPLIVRNGFNSTSEFEVAANPNGLGIAAPLSIWSNALITLSGTSQHSCLITEFNDGNCSVNTYSDHSIKQADIADDSASFPADLVSYLFNTPASELTHLEQQSDFLMADCNSLGNGSWGFIWIDGDCEVSANTQIGSAAEPIILVIFNGDVLFQSDVILYGLLFSFKPAASLKALDITMQTDSAVFGAVVTNYQLGSNGDSTRVVYQADVLQKLQDSKKLQRVAKVPGSWFDF